MTPFAIQYELILCDSLIEVLEKGGTGLENWVYISVYINKLLLIFLSEACVIVEEITKKHNITYRWIKDQKLYSKSGEYVEFSCMSGYKKANKSPPLRTMCIDGHIDYPSCIKRGSWFSGWMNLCLEIFMHITNTVSIYVWSIV